jgi:cellulose synthase operon protein C
MKSISFALLLIAGGSLVAPLARADDEGQKRGDAKLELSSDKRKARKKKAEEDQKKLEERQGPARFQAPQEEVERSEMADQKRDEAIERLKVIIRNPSITGEQKSELFFQLAELWWEKSKSVQFKEMRKYDAEYQKWLAETNKGSKKPEPKVNNRESELYRSEVMRLYSSILKDYPTYSRKDEVLFNYAYNLYDVGKRDQAIEKYVELIKQYPDSKFVGDAFVQMGEHFFNTNQLAKARRSYEEAAKIKDPKVRDKIYPFATYKLAWCDYNAGDYDSAIQRFKKVVSFTESQGKGGTDLKREALRDMVKSFEKVDAVEEAWKYFEAKTNAKDARRLEKKLADQFEEAGKHDASIKTFRYLVNSDSNDPDAPEYENAIVHAYEGLHQRDKVKKEMLRMVELYRPTSPWAKTNASNKSAIHNACEITETAMRTMVTDYHAEAQKTKSVETYKLARDIYKNYLDNFAQADVIKDCEYDEEIVAQAYTLRYYYADILWSLQEWEPAATQYAKVAEINPKGPYSRNAQYNALLCFDKLAKGISSNLSENQKIDEKKKKESMTGTKVTLARHEKGAKEEAIPKWDEALVQGIDKYVSLYPGDQDEIELRYKSAKIYYDHYHDVEAAKRFGEIISRWPTDKRSGMAANLSLDLLIEKEEWGELNKLAREFHANKKLATSDKSFPGRVADLIESSQYKYISEDIDKKQGKKAEAAEAFLAFAKEFPKSKYSPQALVYAMETRETAAQLDLGIEVGERLLKEYPEATDVNKNSLIPRVLWDLGQDYEKTSDFKKSAEYYERYAEHFLGKLTEEPDKGKKGKKKETKVAIAKKSDKGKGEKADDSSGKIADALYNAGLWNEGLGNYDHAIALYTRYIKEFPDRKEVPAAEIFFNIGLIYEKQKKWTDAAKVFAAYVDQYQKVLSPGKGFYGRYKEWLATREMKDDRAAKKLLDDLIKDGAKLPKEALERDDVRNGYGQVRFVALEPDWQKYTSLKFGALKSFKKKDLPEKIAQQQKLEKAYTEVLQIGSADWGIAALTRIGQSYKEFADSISAMPDPKGFDEDQLAMFRNELEARYVFPMEDKAVEAFEKACAKSAELSIYNDWTLEAQNMINKVKPNSFGDVRQIPFQGSELFATAKPITALSAGSESTPAPAPAPAPAAKPAPTTDSDSAGAGSGSN